MMKLLLVEDDEDKREQLMLFVKHNVNCELEEVRSFQSAVRALKSEKFDLILMDMSMPTFDKTYSEPGGRLQPFGGELLLSEMVRREIPTKVIVVTQFDIFGEGDQEITLKVLDERLNQNFPNNYIGAIQYSISYTGWDILLLEKINNLIK